MATKTATKVKLQPLGNRVVVQRDESLASTAGGIILPDAAKDKPARGVVISVGDGQMQPNGSRSEMQVKPGDHVLFSSYGPETFEDDGAEYLLLAETDILAILE